MMLEAGCDFHSAELRMPIGGYREKCIDTQIRLMSEMEQREVQRWRAVVALILMKRNKHRGRTRVLVGKNYRTSAISD